MSFFSHQSAEQDIDLLICDIEMPNMSGLNFVKNLQNPPLTIFVTMYRDYALDCYDISPIDFLLKPLDLDRFFKSIEKVRKHLEQVGGTPSSIEPYFFIRENQNYVQIRYKDVLYIKSQDNFVHIVTAEQIFMPSLSISKLEEKLKNDIFLRVHRSYLVHRNAIAKVMKNDIILTNGQEIPIGDQYRNKINQKHIDGYNISSASL